MIDPQIAPAAIVQASLSIDCHQAALAYQNLNLSVLPLNGKRPALISWTKYQFAPPTADEIAAWQHEDLFGNVGIICDRPSDNLVVIDFDGPGGYPAFAATFPNLAETYTVATGGGVGKHIYLRVDKLPPTVKAMKTPIGHIELRSSGAYVAAVPSGQIRQVLGEMSIIPSQV